MRLDEEGKQLLESVKGTERGEMPARGRLSKVDQAKVHYEPLAAALAP